jgi:hypothetical protein
VRPWDIHCPGSDPAAASLAAFTRAGDAGGVEVFVSVVADEHAARARLTTTDVQIERRMMRRW